MIHVQKNDRKRWLGKLAIFQWLGLLAVSVGLSASAQAQAAQQPYGLEFTDRFRVVAGTDTLPNPWAGGFNSAAFSKMDFDSDGTPDLLVWDGRAQRPLTFVARAGQWEHAPAYQAAFPAPDSGKVAHFALLRDYDGDGRPDLFITANQYVRLYRQEVTPGVGVGFRFVRVSAPYLQTEVAMGAPLFDVLVAPWTTWDATDVDADGDLDLVAYELNSTRIKLQRNQAGAGAVPVFREDLAWSGITFCGGMTQRYAFAADGTTCRPAGPQHTIPAATLAAPDLDGDGDHDLLLGHEYIADLAQVFNQGTTTQELFTSTGLISPYLGTTAHPVQLLHAPSAFWEDVTFDQQPDLVVSPWLVLGVGQLEDLFDTRQSAHLFAAGAGGLAFQQPDFLQSGMIEVGENAAPTLGDLDGDGDLDLLVGNEGDYLPSPTGQLIPQDYRAQLRFYRNIGTRQRPVFRLDDADFGQFSALSRRALVPVLTDLDGNGSLDLVLRSSTDPIGVTVSPLSYILNVEPAGRLAAFPLSTERSFTFQVGGLRGRRDLPCFYDVDGDGLRDILLGTDWPVNTALHYLRNRGGDPDTAFQLIDSDFGRLPAALLSLSGCSPAIADLDGNGQPELLTAADDGELRVWPQLLAQSTVPTPNVSNLVRNDLTTVFGPARLGRRPVLTTGDLDNDGRPEVLVGTPSGGVRLLRSQPNGIVGQPERAAAPTTRLTAFPNPVAPTGPAARLTIQWSGSAPTAVVTLVDVLGRVARQTTAMGGATQLDVASLPAGIYSLRVQPAGGSMLQQRILVRALEQ